jgi:RNA polymerase sigma-70 factor (ECF subfamily)
MSSYPTAWQSKTAVHRGESGEAELTIHVERTDNQLVELVLAGDPNAFEEIFDRHKRLVAIIAGRFFRGHADIEEILQITFAKAYADLGSFRGDHGRSLASWLVRITSNVCFDTLRSQRRKPEKLDCDLSSHEAEMLSGLTSDNSCHAEQAAVNRDLIEKLFTGLNADDRMLLEMLYADDMSVADIAEFLGWSTSNVKIRAWRARAALRKILRRYL